MVNYFLIQTSLSIPENLSGEYENVYLDLTVLLWNSPIWA